jgi:hypothetical protein
MKLKDIADLSNSDFAKLSADEVEEAFQDGRRQLEGLRAMNRADRERANGYMRELAMLEAGQVVGEDGQLFLFEVE